MSRSVSCIIPAFDEGPRIAAVLETVCRYGFDSVVVVDDGSSDDTYAVALNYPVIVTRHEKNLGKGKALESGISRAHESDYYLFLDADLIGLQEKHVDALLEPLAHDARLQMTIGVFTGGKVFVDLAQRYFPVLNGQRALRRAFVEELPDISGSGFGVEILLNRFAEARGYPFSYVPLEGITHWTKEAKFGLLPGAAYRLKMYGECLKTALTYRRQLSLR